MEYTLTRSRRKTVALYVREDGTAEVRAPLRLPKAEIDRFVASKADWLAGKRAQRQTLAARRAAFELRYGDTVLYKGKEYPIAAREGKRVGFDAGSDAADACFFLPPGLDAARIKAACVQIYRLQAKNELAALAAQYARAMGVRPAAVKVSGARTRWGSCSAKGSLNFSWRLMMADDPVIRYVVVHELAHLRELNHSPRFWAVVAGVVPDYAARRARLTELQLRLGGEDWE